MVLAFFEKDSTGVYGRSYIGVTVMDMLNFNSIIYNHCVQKIILSENGQPILLLSILHDIIILLLLLK